jgi:hypothetical protein
MFRPHLRIYLQPQCQAAGLILVGLTILTEKMVLRLNAKQVLAGSIPK